MKKIFNHIATTLTAALLLLPFLASCSSDDAGGDGQETSKGKVNVTLLLSASNLNEDATNGSGTKATRFDDTNAASGEMMKNSIIIVVDKDNKVEYIREKTYDSELEQEEITDVKLTSGAKTIYSFANISLSDIGTITKGSAMPDLSEKAIATNGNLATIPTTGIPMSNKQTVTITGTDQTVNLWTVRMYAKIELQITNDTDNEISLNSVTLSDITSNGQKILLLPNPLEDGTTTSKGQSVNMPTGQTTANYTYTPSSAISLSKDDPQTVTFYVNESTTPTNNFGLFILTLNTTTGTNTTTAKYALISNTDSKWDYIARNDYRVIPVRLTDYKFELELEQFEAIGVIPYWVNKNEVFTCTFYNPGHFHIKPKVTKISSGSVLSYGTDGNSTTPTWSLKEYSSTLEGHDNEAIYASTTDTNHEDGSGNKLSYTGTPLWSGYDHLVYGHFKNTLGSAWCSLSVIVHDGKEVAKRTYTYQLCIERKSLSASASGVNLPTLSSGSLFGYGKLLKAEQR